jgi:hypothetical protein
MNISTLIEVFGWGIDYGLLIAEQERDGEDMTDALLCYEYSRRMNVPSPVARRRQPHTDAWRQAKQASIAAFINLCAKGEFENA